MASFSEKELQDAVIKVLKDEEILSIINGKERLENILVVDKTADFFPGYQIDFQLKTKFARSALSVFEALGTTEIINGEAIKNISLQKDTKDYKERLYPDIILANYEKSNFILIEIKKDRQTEREAITELLAYAIELKNHLPNIADSDINLIVLSTEFNTLLDHSICSLILGTKFNTLAIKAILNDEKLFLDVHIPNGWTDIWQKELPPYAFSSITLVPYQDNNKKVVPDKLGIVEIISDLIMFEGAKNNSHGFFLIWDNISFYDYVPEFCITIYQINPFVFLQSSIDSGNRLNSVEPLSQYVLQKFENEGPYNHMQSLNKTAIAAKSFLDKYYDTAFEDISSWTEHMRVGSSFREQALPIVFNSWGDIGDYIRYFFSHPAIQGNYITEQQLNSIFYYKDPIYGIEMINRISGITLFNDGIFKPSGIFKYAIQLREYMHISELSYRTKLEGKDYKLVRPRLFYAAIDLISSNREVYYRANTTRDDLDGFQGLKIFLGDIEESQLSVVDDYIESFTEYFLKGNPFYQLFFEYFIDWAGLFIDLCSKTMKPTQKEHLENQLIDMVHSFLIDSLTKELIDNVSSYGEKLKDLIKTAYFGGKMPDFRTQNEIENRITSIPRELILRSFDSIFMEILDLTQAQVFHNLAPLPNLSSETIDWDNLKSHLVQKFNEGERYGTVFIQPNGIVAIGLLPLDQRQHPPISDPYNEVFFSINHTGVVIILKKTWEEIKQGDIMK